MSLSIKKYFFPSNYSLFPDFCLKSVKDAGEKVYVVEIEGSV